MDSSYQKLVRGFAEEVVPKTFTKDSLDRITRVIRKWYNDGIYFDSATMFFYGINNTFDHVTYEEDCPIVEFYQKEMYKRINESTLFHMIITAMEARVPPIGYNLFSGLSPEEKRILIDQQFEECLVLNIQTPLIEFTRTFKMVDLGHKKQLIERTDETGEEAPLQFICSSMYSKNIFLN